MSDAPPVADMDFGGLHHAVDDDRIGQDGDDLVSEDPGQGRDVGGLGGLGERCDDLVARQAQRDRAVLEGQHGGEKLAHLADRGFELEVHDPHAGQLAERVEHDIAQLRLTLNEDHAERDVVLGRLDEVGGHVGLRDERARHKGAAEASGPLGAGGARGRAHMTTRRTSSSVV